MAALTNDLLARIRARAENPDTRNDSPPSTRGRTVTVGPLSIVGLQLNGEPVPPAEDSPLAAPAGAAEIARIEGALGFPLPADLKRLHTEIADGGFGPAGGLMPLAKVRAAYAALLANPPGWRGQKWPPHLLPIEGMEPGYVCIDMRTETLIFWDEEELADGPSDKVWKRSFKSEAPDLASWFADWLGKPSPEEVQRSAMEEGMRNQLRQSIAYFRAMTPAQRAEYGLPETGWEQEMFGHLGIDLTGL